MAKIISIISSLLKYLNKFIYKFILFLDSHFVDVNQDSKSNQTYYEPFRKFKVDEQPIIDRFQQLDYQVLLNEHYEATGKHMKPVKRKTESVLNFNGVCPVCGAPHQYIYENNIEKKQLLCKVCKNTFTLNRDYLDKVTFRCPHCGRSLDRIKDRSNYIIFKCRSNSCSYYKKNLDSMSSDERKLFKSNPHDFKVRYIYRAFDLELPDLEDSYLSSINAKVNLSKIRHAKHTLGLILTYYVNYGLSSRKTAAIMKDVHEVKISHQTIINYVNSVAGVVQPFLENFDYNLSNEIVGDETYIKIKGKKGYIFFFSDKVNRIITSYQVFMKRDTFSAIKSLYQTFNKFDVLPNNLKVIVDGNPIYNAAHTFFKMEDINFDLFQVVGLTNNTSTDRKYRPHKQITERMNRSFKEMYIHMNGFASLNNANSYMVLFATCFNFLRPHKGLKYRVPVELNELKDAPHMPAKWTRIIDLSYQLY